MFIDALKIFSWEGRICRWQYIVALLFTLFVVGISLNLFGVRIHSSSGMWVFICIRNIAWVPSHIKRLHDIGWSDKGVFLLVIFPIFSFILVAMKGDDGANEYGPEPTSRKNGYCFDSLANSRDKNVGATSLADKWYTLGDDLGKFIVHSTEHNALLESRQEKLEMRYLLLMETDHLIFGYIRKHWEQVTDAMLMWVLAEGNTTMESLKNTVDEYHSRMPIYKTCEALISAQGATVGTRAFTLSHFLQKARGKTTGRDVLDVITRKRELKSEDLTEFLDVSESDHLVMSVLEDLTALKHIIDERNFA